MRLYIFRHGQTARNLHPELIGQSPTEPLSEMGVQQAQLLGKRIKNEGIKFEEIYSSPYKRAMETCHLALDVSGDHITVDDNLREYSTGDAQDKLRHELVTEDMFSRMMDLGMHFGWPNGETLFEVEKRAALWLYSMLQKHRHDIGNIAVFSHGMLIKCLLHYILQFDHKMAWRLSIDNTSVSVLDYKLDHWFLKSINDQEHLPKEMRK